MNRLVILLAIAAMGVAFASWTAAQGAKRPPTAEPVVPAALSPFARTVAGSGIVEPASQVIAIGSPINEVIAQVAVESGRQVATGDVLIRLDDRQTKAQEAVEQAAVAAAVANVAVARTVHAEAKEQAARATGDLLSIEERSRRTFAVANAEAHIAQAEAALAQAQAGLNATRTELDRRVIRAPIAGTVLRVNARVGEFAPAGRIDPPLLTLGDVSHLQLRVDIDENDAWRVVPTAKAEAAVRGNPSLTTPLTFLRIEPYVVPKKSLTGLSSERVDTRVLQVIYQVAKADLRLYAGQQMDVFINTAEVP